MSMLGEISLNRKLSCESYSLIMTVSKFEGQDEILAVLKLFEEHESVAKSTVNTELLSQPAESNYGQNVLKAVELYGLIRNASRGRYDLTEMGRSALDLKKVPLPNRGLFEVMVSYDPLLLVEILDIVDVEQDGLPNLLSKRIEELPEELNKTLDRRSNRILFLAARSREAAVIVEYSRNGAKAQYKGNLGISLKLKYGEQPKLYFNGKTVLQIDAPKDIDSFTAIMQLLEEEGELRLINNELTLLVRTADLTSSELRNFKKTFKVSKPSIERYGTFEPLEVDNLKIAPVDLAEANKWARKLLLESIDQYVGEKQYNTLIEEICNQFKPLYDPIDISSNLPDYRSAIKSALRGERDFNKSFWYLVAPRDLSPRRDSK